MYTKENLVSTINWLNIKQNKFFYIFFHQKMYVVYIYNFFYNSTLECLDK